MQNLGLWGDVSHLLQKQHETEQHETVLLVVKSYTMWVCGGVAYIYMCAHGYVYARAIGGGNNANVFGGPVTRVLLTRNHVSILHMALL